MRKLVATAGLVALLLAACTQSPGTSATPSVAAQSEMALPSASSLMSEEPTGSATAMSCTQAFASLSPTDLQGISSLSGAQAVLDATFSSCATVEDWATAAQTVLPSVDLSQAEQFVKDRCQANSDLATTPLCTSVAS